MERDPTIIFAGIHGTGVAPKTLADRGRAVVLKQHTQPFHDQSPQHPASGAKVEPEYTEIFPIQTRGPQIKSQSRAAG